MEPALTPDAAAAICRHMNEDHEDALVGYARTFAGVADAVRAEMLGIDATGMDLRVVGAGTARVARIAFDHPLTDSTDARETLIAMAGAAHADAGHEPRGDR